MPSNFIFFVVKESQPLIDLWRSSLKTVIAPLRTKSAAKKKINEKKYSFALLLMMNYEGHSWKKKRKKRKEWKKNHVITHDFLSPTRKPSTSYFVPGESILILDLIYDSE